MRARGRENAGVSRWLTAPVGCGEGVSPGDDSSTAAANNRVTLCSQPLDQMLLAVLVLAAVAVVCWGLLQLLLPYNFLPRRNRQLLAKIPGPRNVPYLGNILMFMGPHEEILPKIQRMFREYGPIFKITALGLEDVFVSSVDDVEVLLSTTQHIEKGPDYLLLQPWLGTGLLTSSGGKWHAHRKMLTPAFHFRILEEFVPVFSRNADILVGQLERLAGDQHVDITRPVSRCALDIICETAMGTSVDAQRGGGKEYVRAVHRMSRLFQHRQISPWLWRPTVFDLSPSGREQKKVLATLHGFTDKVIKERRAEYRQNKMNNVAASRKRLTFLDLLIRVSEEEQEGVLTDEDIREEVNTFMFEGHDTTSAAISWALFLLGSHQDVQDKVVEELRGIFGNSSRSPDFQDLQGMHYLEQVIKESLRLYPSVPGFSRTIESDFSVRGYTIPSGTGVTVLPYVIHRDPAIYPDPERFDPERFTAENCRNRHPFAYLPFSAGPRNCIGKKFALLEEKAVLSSILRNFKVTSLDKREEVSLLVELILRPKNGLKIKLTPRI
ncbi:cytochrome P450 4C1-like isoform X2 [Bacillus rossius redtenbacheri]|uniref:cytochrome P450 4C1-like isoform X2 n=2 Tax=Bacillus rossius redtenbacheri TaxID=93214 RepID=UPI002FDD3298